MLPVRIYEEEWSVDARLREVFDVKRSDFFPIIREVVGARADAVENDPISAAGQFAYIHGTRNTRALFRPKSWLIERRDNIELVRHPDRPLMVRYQSVDLACSGEHNPQAISGKGAGSRRVINEAQLSLFPLLEPVQTFQSPLPIMTGLWHLCVSVNGEDVRAEISLSRGIEDKNFSGFIERIFLVKKGEWADLDIKPEVGGDAVEFEPVISRK